MPARNRFRLEQFDPWLNEAKNCFAEEGLN